MDLYLITGFLGAGKTTSIQYLLGQLKDKKVALIINEFGKQGIDGKILEHYDVALKEVNNGSIFCACKIDKFEQVLEEVIGQQPEIILIETSGLSDPTSARTIIEKEKFSTVDYKGCLAIVDAKTFHKVIRTVNVSKKQIRIADTVVINKVDLVEDKQVEVVTKEVYLHNPYVTMQYTQFGQLKYEWLEALVHKDENRDENILKTRDLALQKVLITLAPTCTYKQLEYILQGFIEETYRIKGFVTIEGKGYLVDCVGDDLCIKPYKIEIQRCNQVVALAAEGKSLMRSLERVRGMYCEQLLAVER